MGVLNDILHDDGMLDSRANPGTKTFNDVCSANFDFFSDEYLPYLATTIKPFLSSLRFLQK